MKHKFAKVMHIINCLVSFCHHEGASEYNIHLKPDHDFMEFLICATVKDMKEEHLNELEKALSLKRMHEVEQDYWELGGESDSYYELTLIGMMLDESEVKYNGDLLEIRAMRKQ